MTTPEPLLEMTLQEKEWAQDAYRTLIELHPMGYAVKHALDILLRVEAGRQRAEHELAATFEEADGISHDDCEKCVRTPADWLAAVKRKVMEK